MTLFLGFGNGQDGAVTVTDDTVESPIDSACSGAAEGNSLVATNENFEEGQIILIIQMTGDNAGECEMNKIESYTAGEITTVLPLTNTYVNSGNSKAQVRTIPQITDLTISSGKTYKCKDWNGTVGGILALIASGVVTNEGIISAAGTDASNPNNANTTGGGFYGGGGDSTSPNSQYSYQGGGTTGVQTKSTSVNGNGAGGAYEYNPYSASGGGGGNGTAGNNGASAGSGIGGVGGSAVGLTDLSKMFMGGGGSGGAIPGGEAGGNGGSGGGIILIIARNVINTGLITADGGDGNTGDSGTSGGGGGGAGGTVFIKSQTAILGDTLVTASGGSGKHNGGSGGSGIIRIESCSITGSTNPSNSAVAGGYTWCANNSAIL